MRVVGGTLRGRAIEGPADDTLRPTSDRARQALFNILEHGRYSRDGRSLLPGARVLDAFCGTGAFAIEALSRGASHATLLDSTGDAIVLARRNLKALGLTAKARVVQADATRPPPAGETHTIAFLDPPYRSALAAPALAALAAAGWLAPGALCIVETEAREKFVPPFGFTIVDDRRYGRAKLTFLTAS
jgi:16S rRNA (guanine966-N2)-methyltransferase